MSSHKENHEMENALKHLKEELSGLATGRASSALIDSIKVEVTGNLMPIKGLATINTPSSSQIVLNVFDKHAVGAIDKAIRAANTGLNPQIDGQVIRINVPTLTEDRRKDILKLASKKAEDARIAIRNIRQNLKKKTDIELKNKKDEHNKEEEAIQKLTNGYMDKINELFKTKEKEILKG